MKTKTRITITIDESLRKMMNDYPGINYSGLVNAYIKDYLKLVEATIEKHKKEKRGAINE